MSRVGAASLALLAAVSTYAAIDARSSAAHAEQRAELAIARAEASEAHAAELVRRLSDEARETTERLTDVERLVIELQDGVSPDAYRAGFPGPEEEFANEPKRKAPKGRIAGL